MSAPGWPKVVVLGAGFGGIEVVRALDGARCDITIIDKHNHHLFQPLLYQVATAGLSPANIAWPIRNIFKHRKNVTVYMAEVEGIDTGQKIVRHSRGETPYDYLVIATGATTSYFGRNEWAEHTIGLKDLNEAMQVRNHVLCQYEAAEFETDERKRKKLLTFVVVGGGPTGVELAGSLAELAKRYIADDFRNVDPRKSRIVLIEAAERILGTFDEELSRDARRSLEEMGVEVWVKHPVTSINEKFLEAGGQILQPGSVFWTAGVTATPAVSWLGVEPARGNRVPVDNHCRVKGFDDVWAIGDVTWFENSDGTALPGVATVAIQQGQYVGAELHGIIENSTRRAHPFQYSDPGSMATIGRKRAVVQRGDLKISGFFAWFAWLFVHLIKIMTFRNKVLVFIQWVWAYVTYQRSARLITRL